MKRAGFYVRMVDLVLILLCGFIVISRIQPRSEIELPETHRPGEPPPAEVVRIAIGIRSDGTYLVEGEQLELRGEHALKDFLGRAQDGESKTKVRIRASHDTPIRYTLTAARVCDQLGLERSLAVIHKPTE